MPLYGCRYWKSCCKLNIRLIATSRPIGLTVNQIGCYGWFRRTETPSPRGQFIRFRPTNVLLINWLKVRIHYLSTSKLLFISARQHICRARYMLSPHSPVRPPVHPSVCLCLSVTRVRWIKMAEDRIMLRHFHHAQGSPIPLVLRYKFSPEILTCFKQGWGGENKLFTVREGLEVEKRFNARWRSARRPRLSCSYLSVSYGFLVISSK